MSPEQVVAILGAVAAALLAFGTVIQRISELRKDLNGRLQQLLDARADAARHEGELAGRDYVHQLYAPPIGPVHLVDDSDP